MSNIKKIYGEINPSALFYAKAMGLLMLITASLGFVGAELLPDEAYTVIKQATDSLGFVEEMNAIQLFAFIFFNNTAKAFFAMVTGLLFGIIPVLFILLNGYTIGVVISVSLAHMSTISIIGAIVPHGILELPAVLLAAGYGVWLGETLYRRMRGEGSLRRNFKRSILKFIYIIIPMLFVAAFIESTLISTLL